MNAAGLDWAALERLRATFLEARPGLGDYWESESALASYDATFAQRIGWKWDHVLEELARLGWRPPGGDVLDWACGSGIAGRAFLHHFGRETVRRLCLSDRSTLATNFAARRAREKHPSLAVHAGVPTESADGGAMTLLLSHVLNELDEAQLNSLLKLATRATCVLWVEPGTHQASRALGAVRERLRGEFQVVAPCTHQRACGILAPGQERHWCHQLARPPGWVFTDGDWARFATLTGIDLRRLALSYLVLDRRAVPALPGNATRILGLPRCYKAHGLLFACDASGVKDRRLTKRAFPELFRQLRKGILPDLLALRCEGDDIVEAQPIAKPS